MKYERHSHRQHSPAAYGTSSKSTERGAVMCFKINKASERFKGLSDAAEKSADRATKTPHV